MDEPKLAADETAQADRVRARIVAAAAELIASGGREAATTRAVAAAAGVQAPTIYRLFGDKRGLLNAAAEHGHARLVDVRQRFGCNLRNLWLPVHKRLHVIRL